MFKDFQYKTTCKNGHENKASQNKICSHCGGEIVSFEEVPIEDISVTIDRDRKKYESRGFTFVKFYPTGDGEMYYPGWKDTVRLLAEVKKDEDQIRERGDFTTISLICDGGCTNYWTTRGVNLYSYSKDNVKRITNPKKIDVEILKVIERNTPRGFEFKEYLPNIEYTITHQNGNSYIGKYNFHSSIVDALRKELKGYFFTSKWLATYEREDISTTLKDFGYAIYRAKKHKPLI